MRKQLSQANKQKIKVQYSLGLIVTSDNAKITKSS